MSSGIKTLVGTLGGRVTNKDTKSGLEVQFVLRIWFKPRKTQTSKHLKFEIIRRGFEQNFKGRFERMKWCRHSIYEIEGTLKCQILVDGWKMGLME